MSRIYSWNEQVFVVPETAGYGGVVKPAATDAVRVLNSQMSEDGNERRIRADKRNTRSITGVIQGRRAGTWNLEMYLLGSGAAGTPPDFDDLLVGGFGQKTVNAGASVVYGLTLRNDAKHYNIVRHADGLSQTALGAYVNEMALMFSGTEESRISFSGPCQRVLWTGLDTLQGDVSNDDEITVGNAYNFVIGSIVKVGSQTNGGAGFKILARNVSTNVLQLDANVTASTGDTVQPFQPVATLQAVEPIFGTIGSFTLASGPARLPLRTANFTITNQGQLQNDEYGTEFAQGISLTSRREATGELTYWMDTSMAQLIGKAERRIAQDIQIVAGDTAGQIWTFDADEFIMDFPNVNWPDEGEVEITTPGRLIDSSAAEGEATLTLT